MVLLIGAQKTTFNLKCIYLVLANIDKNLYFFENPDKNLLKLS